MTALIPFFSFSMRNIIIISIRIANSWPAAGSFLQAQTCTSPAQHAPE
jgi:hypothetical protein